MRLSLAGQGRHQVPSLRAWPETSPAPQQLPLSPERFCSPQPPEDRVVRSVLVGPGAEAGLAEIKRDRLRWVSDIGTDGRLRAF